MIALPSFLADLPPVLSPYERGLVVGAMSEEAVSCVLVAEDEIAKFDFAVYTRDVGRILLQVKSSRRGAEEHKRRERYVRPLYRVHVVIARHELPREVVLGRVLAACVVAREEAFAGRCTADHVKLCAREAA